MIIQKYICQGCGKEHERRVYDNKSEFAAFIFANEFFPEIWEKIKQKASEKPLDEFCKDLVWMAIYNYHKNSRSIRIGKDDIIADGKTENRPPET